MAATYHHKPKSNQFVTGSRSNDRFAFSQRHTSVLHGDVVGRADQVENIKRVITDVGPSSHEKSDQEKKEDELQLLKSVSLERDFLNPAIATIDVYNIPNQATGPDII